jgi:uncharacterized damage-inducible protein DinB
MRKITISALALALLALPAAAQDTKPAATGVRAEVLRQIDDAEKKLIQLADATPAEKFAWRPAEGVRTTGEVFMHVAAANYFLPTLWGGKVPEGVDPRGLEKLGADKAKATDTLKKSFENVRQAMSAVPDAEMEKAVKIFGRDGNTREVFLLLATHAHEHLGQSIAYARMTGITPPWSQKGE